MEVVRRSNFGAGASSLVRSGLHFPYQRPDYRHERQAGG